MKQYLKHENLPWLTLLCGGIGLLLRLWLLSTENDKGFITRGHISEILLVTLTVLFLAVLMLATRGLSQGNKYSFNFPPSLAGAVGALVAAAGVAITSAVELSAAAGSLEKFCWFAGFPAACSLLFVAHSRWKGLHPSMLFHAWLCVWLVLVLVCRYRSWSADPQLEHYCYQLLALVFAMISTYHRATFDANFGKRTSYAFFNLGCVYFCLLSVGGPGGALLYLCLGAWQFTDLCRLTPINRRRGEHHEAA